MNPTKPITQVKTIIDAFEEAFSSDAVLSVTKCPLDFSVNAEGRYIDEYVNLLFLGWVVANKCCDVEYEEQHIAGVYIPPVIKDALETLNDRHSFKDYRMEYSIRSIRNRVLKSVWLAAQTSLEFGMSGAMRYDSCTEYNIYISADGKVVDC